MPASSELIWQRIAQQFSPDRTPAGAGAPLFIPLPAQGLLSVEGVDAITFLQGQLTCDVEALHDNQSCPGAHCNAKGRMHSNFILHRQSATHFLLQMPASNAAAALAALAKYAVFSKVSLADVSGELFAFGITTGQSYTSPSLDNATYAIEHTPIGKIFWLDESQVNDLLEQANHPVKKLARGEATDWALANISAGLAFIDESTSLELIPQMINLDCIGGISFDKGCYTGQEIVARMKYLGKLKRRMHRFSVAVTSLQPGDALLDKNGKNIGLIVNVVVPGEKTSNAGGNRECQGLAVITLEAVKDNAVFASGTGEQAVSALAIEPLPYDFPEATDED